MHSRWQDEISKAIVELKIQQNLQGYVWRKVGKGGKNFGYIEGVIASIKDSAKTYGRDVSEYAGNFINKLKDL